MIFNIPTGDDDDGNAAGGAQFITDKQLNTIVDLMAEKNVDEAKFLKYMEVDALDQIQVSHYDKAVAGLRVAKGKERDPGEEG